ncbi:NUDIX hydrolase [Aquihabitans sp. G128]|uniref:NUDIX hydrolase n=1 Tax=Aquihabitans sp. G128 TaxID=2849779 RepID=UPI001C24F711|nr:NUDIX hydrolase [Aquihabitans sp. G128]QXC62369.1 NUDIX hydrolase [Aquihabitans sp. G128]
MRHRLHVLLLQVYQRLPTWARRRIVRTVSPSFTVGAMCFIEREDGALLLVRQVYRRHWGVPGGLLERREDSDDAARREVFEEVELAVELVGEPTVVVDAEPQRVDVVYRARPADGVDPATARPGSPEITEVRWFPRAELPELQHETATALELIERRDR